MNTNHQKAKKKRTLEQMKTGQTDLNYEPGKKMTCRVIKVTLTHSILGYKI